jgi:hypothetical protein
MRVLIDSSVRIDHLRGVRTRETAILGTPLAAGKDVLLSFEVVTIGGADLALEAADHYRALRRFGVTTPKPRRLPPAGLPQNLANPDLRRAASRRRRPRCRFQLRTSAPRTLRRKDRPQS